MESEDFSSDSSFYAKNPRKQVFQKYNIYSEIFIKIMYNQEKLLQKVESVLSDSEKRMLVSLCEDLDTYNEIKHNSNMELYIDFCDEDMDNEWNPYHTFSIRLVKHPEENIVSEISLKELDNCLCALCQYQELNLDYTKEIDDSFVKDNNHILEIIEKQQKEGIIVYMSEPGRVVGSKIENFVKQPIEGQLYDLNRDSATIRILKDKDWSKYNQRWVNDLALVQLVEYYYNRCKSLESACAQKDDALITTQIINGK